MSVGPPSFSLIKSTSRRARLIDMREKVCTILSNRIHSHFTDHSVTHSDRVAELVDRLAEPLQKSGELNDDEAFVLYASCYFHDVGMHNELANETKHLSGVLMQGRRTWADIGRPEQLELIRKHHHCISADMVMASTRDGRPLVGTTLRDEDRPGEIAVLCESHCTDTASKRYRELTTQAERPTMRLTLLSAFLRLADILDEAHHRANVDQARVLALNLESKMHWWRHYYTREVMVEPDRNRVTILFSFPLAKREEYATIVPPLQMPWVELEFQRHREVLASNGLNWHVGLQVEQTVFSTLEEMPAEVKSLMLQELSRAAERTALEARSRLVEQSDQARQHLVDQLGSLVVQREAMDASDYLAQVLELSRDLGRIGSFRTAASHLSGALFHSTHNGRNVDAKLHVEAAILLSRIQLEDEDSNDAFSTLMGARASSDGLSDRLLRVRFLHAVATASFQAGYDGDGLKAAQEALDLEGQGPLAEAIRADLAEAQYLYGHEPIIKAKKRQ